MQCNCYSIRATMEAISVSGLTVAGKVKVLVRRPLPSEPVSSHQPQAELNMPLRLFFIRIVR